MVSGEEDEFPPSPPFPLLPHEPLFAMASSTIILRPEAMSREWEKTLPPELQAYIEAERQSARAAAIAEIRLGKVDLTPPVRPNESPPPAFASVGDLFAEDRPMPRGVGAAYVSEAVRTVAAGSIVSTTDIRNLIEKQKGKRPSFNTIRRALDKLAKRRELIERIAGTDGYRVLPNLRSVG